MEKAQLLIVDDELELERLIKQRLRRQIISGEFELSFVHSGQEALNFLTCHPSVDLVLTDINMMEMNGLTLLEHLSKLHPHLRAIVVSAYGNLQNIQAAMNRGALDFLVKPINFEDFLIAVRRTLTFIEDLRLSQARLQSFQLQLIYLQEMSALGNLVAGVTQELNPPLSFLEGTLQQTQDDVQNLFKLLNLYQTHYSDSPPEIATALESIQWGALQDDLPKRLGLMRKNLEDLQSSGTSLRAFFQIDADHQISYNLHDSLNSVLLLLEHRLKARPDRPEIQLHRAYGEIPPVLCSPRELNQVLMSILSYAIERFEGWGNSESSPALEARPPYLQIDTTVVDHQAQIRIQDNGQVMTQTELARISGPLFMIQDISQGAALELAIAHQIVTEKLRGTLEVQSEVGQGTEFCLRLPLD